MNQANATVEVVNNSVELCRQRGWSVGDVLVGSNPDGLVVRVLVTAIGRRSVLGIMMLDIDDIDSIMGGSINEHVVILHQADWTWMRVVQVPDDPPRRETWYQSLSFWSCVAYIGIGALIALLSMLFDRRR